ncbi:MAG: 30S ribosomal protein S12 methylthiotransferase RimO [Clostridiales bacterium]|nr:30S ribosomal protein S12 methylthiotransferase RimO [Clostridiales bacterium]
MSSVFIDTVGCPKNQDDSERMAGLLAAAGHSIVFTHEEADVIIVNTCGFIEAAKRESLETVFSYAPYKEDGKRLIVTGCLTQRYAAELASDLPEADALLGVNEYEKLPAVIASLAELGGVEPETSLRVERRRREAEQGASESGAEAELDEPETSLRVERRRREAEQGASESEAEAELCEAVASLSAVPLRTRRKARLASEGLKPRLASEGRKPRLASEGRKPRLASEGRKPRLALSPRHSAYLKIAEGCSNHCAYCIIPSIRGPYRSFPIEQVIAEAETLAAEGCKELILIAQDLTRYGQDLYGHHALAEFLKKLCASDATKSIEWIRLLYCYEECVTDELIDVMASEPKILKYIDMPLQHINDGILSSMRRRSTSRSIKGAIARLRAAMPDIVIRTTFITGLPGETEQMFEELYAFIEGTRFDRLGVFAYSPEEGTDAALMPDQVDAETAEARRDALMQLQQSISLENNERLIGSVQDVLAEGSVDEGVYTGRTRADAPEIDDEIIFSAPAESDIIGRIVKVRVTDAMDYDLIGEIIE